MTLPPSKKSFLAVICSALFMMGLVAMMGQWTANAASVFRDVSSSHPYAEAIDEMQSFGIIEGYPDGSFRPDNNITRAELMTLLMRRVPRDQQEQCLLGAQLPLYKDVFGAEWFAGYVCMGSKKGIIEGYPDGSFGPHFNVNLAEGLKIILNTFGLTQSPVAASNEPWHSPYLTVAYEKGLVIPTFRAMDQKLTRAEVAEVLFKISRLDGAPTGPVVNPGPSPELPLHQGPGQEPVEQQPMQQQPTQETQSPSEQGQQPLSPSMQQALEFNQERQRHEAELQRQAWERAMQESQRSRSGQAASETSQQGTQTNGEQTGQQSSQIQAQSSSLGGLSLSFTNSSAASFVQNTQATQEGLQSSQPSQVAVSGDAICKYWDVRTPSISDDGRFITYAANADGRTYAGTTSESQVFLLDRSTGKIITLTNPRGEPTTFDPPRNGEKPLISRDGNTIAFTTVNGNIPQPALVSYNRVQGTYKVILKDFTTLMGMSNDGRYTLLEATGLLIHDRDTNSLKPIVREQHQGTIPAMIQGRAESALLSGNGKYIVVQATDRTQPMVNAAYPTATFVVDHAAGTVQKIAGVRSLQAVNDDGTVLVYGEREAGGYSMFTRNLQTGQVARINDMEGFANNPDGYMTHVDYSSDLQSVVVFRGHPGSAFHTPVLYRRTTGERIYLGTLHAWRKPILSGNGKTFVAEAMATADVWFPDGILRYVTAEQLYVQDVGGAMTLIPQYYECPPNILPVGSTRGPDTMNGESCKISCPQVQGCSYTNPVYNEYGCNLGCGTLSCAAGFSLPSAHHSGGTTQSSPPVISQENGTQATTEQPDPVVSLPTTVSTTYRIAAETGVWSTPFVVSRDGKHIAAPHPSATNVVYINRHSGQGQVLPEPPESLLGGQYLRSAFSYNGPKVMGIEISETGEYIAYTPVWLEAAESAMRGQMRSGIVLYNTQWKTFEKVSSGDQLIAMSPNARFIVARKLMYVPERGIEPFTILFDRQTQTEKFIAPPVPVVDGHPMPSYSHIKAISNDGRELLIYQLVDYSANKSQVVVYNVDTNTMKTVLETSNERAIGRVHYGTDFRFFVFTDFVREADGRNKPVVYMLDRLGSGTPQKLFAGSLFNPSGPGLQASDISNDGSKVMLTLNGAVWLYKTETQTLSLLYTPGGAPFSGLTGQISPDGTTALGTSVNRRIDPSYPEQVWSGGEPWIFAADIDGL